MWILYGVGCIHNSGAETPGKQPRWVCIITLCSLLLATGVDWGAANKARESHEACYVSLSVIDKKWDSVLIDLAKMSAACVLHSKVDHQCKSSSQYIAKLKWKLFNKNYISTKFALHINVLIKYDIYKLEIPCPREAFSILVEWNCHDSVCDIKCVFHSITVLGINVNVEHSLMIPILRMKTPQNFGVSFYFAKLDDHYAKFRWDLPTFPRGWMRANRYSLFKNTLWLTRTKCFKCSHSHCLHITAVIAHIIQLWKSGIC